MEIKLIKKNKNQTLRIRLIANKSEKQGIAENRDKYGINSALCDLLEPYTCNGWGLVFGDDIMQMTGCAIISEGETLEDDGTRTLYGKAWTNIHNYQIVDEIEELLTKGYYDFYFWQDFGKGENFDTPMSVG